MAKRTTLGRSKAVRRRRLVIPHSTAPRGTCRWCGLPILRPDGRPDRRRNWHPECVETYKLCWPGHARQRVKERDHGICAGCGRDTVTRRLRRSGPITPRPDDARYAGRYCRAVWTERHAWELDHIVPLADGGTHELVNMQTLCRPCHRTKTAREAAERAQRRKWPNVSAVAERVATAPTEML
jgi:5-methylcytosine-specific restriction endonuclease McrA